MIYAAGPFLASVALKALLLMPVCFAGNEAGSSTVTPIPDPYFSEILSPDFSDLVLDMYRDSYGFMWLGTSRGLVRYDAYQIRWYRTDPDDETSLSGAEVRAIAEDHAGNFWVGTNLGLNLMNRRTGTFKRFRHDAADPDSLWSDTILDLCTDRNGDLWICTMRGINRFMDGKMVRADNQGIEGLGQGPAALDRRGNLWLAGAAEGKLYFLPPGGTLFQAVPHLPEAKFSTLFPASDGSLWVGTFTQGVFVLKDGAVVRHAETPGRPSPLAVNYVSAISEDNRGTVWVGTKAGITRFAADGSYRRITRHGDGRKGSLLNNSIRALYFSDDIMWVSADDAAVQTYDLRRERFQTYEMGVLALYEDLRGRVWVGNHQGIRELTPEGPGDWLARVEFVRSMLDRDGGLLVGTDKVLLMLHPETGAREVLAQDQRFWCLLPKGDDAVWVGTNHGLQVLGPDGVLQPLPPDTEAGRRLATPIVTSLADAGDGNLWVGTYDRGLYYLHGKDLTVTSYTNSPDNPGSLSSDDVLALHLDRRGRLWVATLSGGLCRLDDPAAGFVRYTVKDGFPDNAVAALAQDAEGRLWANTGVGLVKIDPELDRRLIYRAADGVASGTAVPGAMLCLRDGDVLVGGTAGIARFSPAEFGYPEPPKVVFTSVRAGGEELSQLLLPEETVSLGNDEKTFSLDFSVLDYRAPGHQRVAFKREGLDDDWVTPGTGRTINYTRYLSFGGVGRLSVEAASALGVTHRVGISLEVEQPTWVTWLPLSLPGGLAALVGMIYAGISYRERIKRRHLIAEARLARQQKTIAEQRARIAERERSMEHEERRLQEERSMILHEHLEQLSTEIANELHDGPLGELHGLGFRLNALVDDPECLPTQRREIMSCTHDLLPRVCADLRNICGDLLSPDFQFGLDTELDGYMDMVQDREEGLRIERVLESDEAGLDRKQMATYFRICRTLLKNVVKHAEADTVKVVFRVEDDRIILTMHDNGRGFEVPADWETFKRNKHYGMYMANYFAESIGGSLQVDSTLGVGTMITVSSPLDQSKQGVPREAYSHRDC